uniref:Uncharacterized protein n=1 Tax=Compsopogon caeruleus TaxID=31354 RepID=A0A7S1TI25_9RHOD|mmetsp:Transcript_7629/g.15479  ORF Transcript_7629/g.15479 Transcript_7629/m.15479 type:complete len:402 (+) Transcript_7629:85-1290(+)
MFRIKRLRHGQFGLRTVWETRLEMARGRLVTMAERTGFRWLWMAAVMFVCLTGIWVSVHKQNWSWGGSAESSELYWLGRRGSMWGTPRRDGEGGGQLRGTLSEGSGGSTVETEGREVREGVKQGGSVRLRGRREEILGMEVVWQRPSVGLERERGVWLLAHGCSHSATDFWDRDDPLCLTCIGLPEEKRITRRLLEENYAVIAVSSSDREVKCWHPRDESDHRVVQIIREWMTREHLTGLPVYLLGVSSGGGLVVSIAEEIHAAGVVCEVSVPHAWDSSITLVVVTMEQDRMSVQRAAKLANGHSIFHVRARAIPLTTDFFSSRIENFSRTCSSAMAQAFEKHGYVNVDGFLMTDPRHNGSWRKLVTQACPGIVQTDSLKPDQSPVSEELNVAVRFAPKLA